METSPATSRDNQNLSANRYWDWKAALLTVAIVEISSTRLVVTEWSPFLYFTQTMGFIGVIIGLAIGTSNFSRPTALRIAAGYTIMLIPYQLLSTVERMDWLWLDLLAVFERLIFSLNQFIKNKPVYDDLFFVSIVTLAYWGIGISAGYWLTRHRDFLNVVLPSGLAILIVQAFDPVESKHIWELALFLIAALLLLGRIYFLQNNSFWKKSRFLLTEEAINDLERVALTITLASVFIAWSLPGWINGIKPAAKAWNEFSQPVFDKFSNAVSALESPYTGGTTGGDFYSDALALGQQAALSETMVFTVELNKDQFTPLRNYWKGRVYDLYFNGRWTTVSDASEPFNPSIDELSVEYPNERHETEFTFTSGFKKQNLLYMPSETIWVSKNADMQTSSISDGINDITSWVATTSLSSGNQYKVRSLIADPSIEELRSIGTEYPAWVTNRYLQIPEEITPQLRKLALEITASHNTVYDKVQAITSYLRKEIEYDAEIEDALPENRDPVLWVLFEYKKGFCMYYASAETLMLRSIGIPARMAVGFVEGTYDETEGQYTVTYKDSHAWPEVYFPGIGWVEFEPTSNQFPIERPETKDNPEEIITNPEPDGNFTASPLSPAPLQQSSESLNKENGSSLTINKINRYKTLLVSTLVLFTFGLVLFIIRRYSLNDRLPVYLTYQYEKRGNSPPHWLNNWARWTKLSAIERAFQAVNLSLYWLGLPQPAYITPQTRADILINRLPAAQDQTQSLLQEYHKTLFTDRDGNIAAARKAAAMILLKTWNIRLKETIQFLDTRYNQLR